MLRRYYLTLAALLLGLGGVGGAERGAYFQAADGSWRPLAARHDTRTRTVSFTLDPAQLRRGATMVVLDPPPGTVLDDREPPLLTGLKLDALACRNTPALDLDWLPAHPTSAVFAFADRANALDPTSLTVRLNGRPLPAGRLRLQSMDTGHHVRLTVPLAALAADDDRLLTTLEVRLADASPQRNTTTHRLTYRCLQRVTGSPALFTDSCCPGYEDLGVLLDGKLMTPGETTYGCTWASVEEPGDHWLVLAWPEDQPQRVSGVEIAWANYQATFWAARRLLVQAWVGRRWVTQKTAENLPAAAAATIAFPPLTTTRLRLLQPDGQGHPSRPNIMWLTEVRVLEEK